MFDLVKLSTLHLRNLHQTDFEGNNSHLIFIDINGASGLRLVILYRSFDPQGGISARDNFKSQLNLVVHATTAKKHNYP